MLCGSIQGGHDRSAVNEGQVRDCQDCRVGAQPIKVRDTRWVVLNGAEQTG